MKREPNPGRLESASLVVLDDSAWRLKEAWDFARRLLLALPPESDACRVCWRGCIIWAAHAGNGEGGGPPDVARVVARLVGPQLAAHASPPDMRTSTRPGCGRSRDTSQVLAFLLHDVEIDERYDEFRFLCSQTQQYAWIEEDCSNSSVRSGTASMMVDGNPAGPCGSSPIATCHPVNP